MSSKTDHAELARQATYLASTCAKWAGDLLILPEEWSKPVDMKTLARFTDEIRHRLNIIDRSAGRADAAITEPEVTP